MADYTSTRSGPPDAGFFSRNDRYTDADGVTYICVRGGQASASPFPMSSRAEFRVLDAAQNAGAKSGSTVSALELGDSAVHTTVLTVTALPLTISNADPLLQASGLKIYGFPEGRILLLGGTLSMAETTTSAILTTLNGGSTCKVSLGTTIGTNSTLATTEVDLMAAVSITSSATINVAGATATGNLVVPTGFDGTATAKSMFLNFAVPTDGDLDGDATVTLTGTVRFSWVFLGDY